jgi:hypothetical protein
VSNETFKIQGKEKNVLEKEMKQKGFPLEFLKSSLLSITVSKLSKLQEKIKMIEHKLKQYKNKEPIDIWLSELDELNIHI